MSVELEFFRFSPIPTAECIKQILYKCFVCLYHLWRIHEFISDQGSMYLSLVSISVTSKVRWGNSLFYYETSASGAEIRATRTSVAVLQ